MYGDKIKDLLDNLEDPSIDLAGGSVIGINLSLVNSLIIYICNLTIGKEKYQEYEDILIGIKEKACEYRNHSIDIIDRDKEVLEDILISYKTKNNNPKKYSDALIEAVDFALYVIKLSYDTKKLSEEIALYGNKMLKSDFNICKFYSESSIKSAYENFYINVNGLNDDVKLEYENMLNELEERYK